MATMASTSHGLSVFASHCVKNPILPKTGLTSTINERSKLHIRYSDALNEINELGNTFPRPGVDGRDWLPEQTQTSSALWEQLHNAKAEEFYEKLQQLKEENKRTLDCYEQMYQNKLSYSQSFDKSCIDQDSENETGGLEIDTTVKSRNREILTKKPPPARSPKKSTEEASFSKTLPQSTLRTMVKEALSGSLVNNIRRSRSLDQEDWRELFRSQIVDGEDTDFIIPSDTLSDHEKALQKVDKLWEDFDIAKYSQQSRKHSSSSVQNKNRVNEQRESKKSEWRHRITIPEPFNMSVREALKNSKKTKAQIEAEQRRLQKEREEEAECEKKFKARPVPSHVYLPKYDEIKEKNESRRKYVKQYCQELLQSQVKPFNFEIREEEKKKQRVQSAPTKRPERPKSGFKAKPIPTNIFKPDIDERLQEEEELRKIRIRMRSKELLREASLPPNMAEREKMKEQEKKEKLRQAKQAARRKGVKSFSKKAHVVPDYDMLYREFQKELSRRKMSREGTVLQPFNLETHQIHSHREKIKRDMEQDEKRLKENRWPFEGSRETPRSSLRYLGTLSTSLDSIPTHLTRSAELRSTVVKKDKERQMKRQQQIEEEEQRRRVREAKLRKHLIEKSNSADVPRVKDSIPERLRRKRQEERAAEEAYQKQIEEMKARVDESPLLVEKYIKENAKREAEKKFSRTVQGAGFRESEFRHGTARSRTDSVDRYDSDGSDREDNREEEGFSSTGYIDTTYTKGDDDDDDEN